MTKILGATVSISDIELSYNRSREYLEAEVRQELGRRLADMIEVEYLYEPEYRMHTFRAKIAVTPLKENKGYQGRA